MLRFITNRFLSCLMFSLYPKTLLFLMKDAVLFTVFHARICSRVYIGQTGNSLKTRIGQHRAALRLLQPAKSAVAEHSLDSDHAIDWSNAAIVATEKNWRQRLFLEAWFSKTVNALNRVELQIPPSYSPLWRDFNSSPPFYKDQVCCRGPLFADDGTSLSRKLLS